MNHSAGVKHYYEKNTQKFLRFHQDAATKSIHQPLWKNAQFTLTQAIHYANELILEVIKTYPATNELTIMDLGCGVGSSLFYIADKLEKKANFYGISISETQVNIANTAVKEREINEQLITDFQFITADFTSLPTNIPTTDIIFSIEAFIHSATPNAYLAQVSRYLRKGGKLILIDDFLIDNLEENQLAEKIQRAIADFKYGWMANSLISKNRLARIATTHNLKIIEEEDLTPYMHNNTLKHKWIRFWVKSFRWLYDLLPSKSPYFRSWIGGVGKQYCLEHGIVKYKKIVLEKVEKSNII